MSTDTQPAATHTPGPWVWELDSGFVPLVSERSGFGIASLPKMGDRSRAEIEANARLIAAAPELLKEWVNDPLSCQVFEFGAAPQAGCDCSTCERMRKARLLIAKATGASQP